ncbi:MAG: hypothetical protein ACK496_12840, partial [Acidobacteriota bacterium]
MMSYAVQHYYQNGGVEAVIVRIAKNASSAMVVLTNGPVLTAKYPGAWGNRLRVRVDYNTDPLNDQTYNLTVRDHETGIEERYLNVSTNINAPRALEKLLQQSQLVTVTSNQEARPTEHANVVSGEDQFADLPAIPAFGEVDGVSAPLSSRFTLASEGIGTDGDPLTDAEYVGDEANKTGIYALHKSDIFNLLVIPPISRRTDVAVQTLSKAAKLCVDRRAMLLVDAPAGWDVHNFDQNQLGTFIREFGPDLARNVALYFPRLGVVDPQMGGALEYFGPTGAI